MENEIIEILSEINPYVDITADTMLLEEEIVDSLAVMVLISELEEKYGIVIPVDQIAAEDFVSVNTIVDLVKKYL